MSNPTTDLRSKIMAQNAPAVSANVVIITRSELEILLLDAFENGMRRAEENIKRNTDAK